MSRGAARARARALQRSRPNDAATPRDIGRPDASRLLSASSSQGLWWCLFWRLRRRGSAELYARCASMGPWAGGRPPGRLASGGSGRGWRGRAAVRNSRRSEHDERGVGQATIRRHRGILEPFGGQLCWALACGRRSGGGRRGATRRPSQDCSNLCPESWRSMLRVGRCEGTAFGVRKSARANPQSWPCMPFHVVMPDRMRTQSPQGSTCATG